MTDTYTVESVRTKIAQGAHMALGEGVDPSMEGKGTPEAMQDFLLFRLDKNALDAVEAGETFELRASSGSDAAALVSNSKTYALIQDEQTNTQLVCDIVEDENNAPVVRARSSQFSYYRVTQCMPRVAQVKELITKNTMTIRTLKQHVQASDGELQEVLAALKCCIDADGFLRCLNQTEFFTALQAVLETTAEMGCDSGADLLNTCDKVPREAAALCISLMQAEGGELDEDCDEIEKRMNITNAPLKPNEISRYLALAMIHSQDGVPEENLDSLWQQSLSMMNLPVNNETLDRRLLHGHAVLHKDNFFRVIDVLNMLPLPTGHFPEATASRRALDVLFRKVRRHEWPVEELLELLRWHLSPDLETATEVLIRMCRAKKLPKDPSAPVPEGEEPETITILSAK